MTHICVSKLTIIGSDNGLSPGRRQAIIWTKAGILLIGFLGTNFIEILIGIQKVSFKKMHLKMSSAKWRPFCPGLNVLIHGISRGVRLLYNIFPGSGPGLTFTATIKLTLIDNGLKRITKDHRISTMFWYSWLNATDEEITEGEEALWDHKVRSNTITVKPLI